MNQNQSKYNFYKQLSSAFQDEFDFEKEIPFVNFLEYSEPLNHSSFVVYEDWWLAKPEVVISKLKSKFGLSKRIFARKTVVKKIDKKQADTFLKENHIYGTVKAKHKLGLFYEKELVAVVTFSPQRNLDVGRSVELVRFCSKNGTTIVGGLDKLITYYENEFQPDHIMTYIDKDWGSGDGFLKLGFKIASERKPIQFCVNMATGNRSVFNSKNESCELKVYNRGSIKVDKYIITKEDR